MMLRPQTHSLKPLTALQCGFRGRSPTVHEVMCWPPHCVWAEASRKYTNTVHSWQNRSVLITKIESALKRSDLM